MILRSYNNIKNYDIKVYALSDFILPIPINVSVLGFSAGVCFVIFILSAVIPFFSSIPFIVRYAIIPYFVTTYLRKKKFDGKKPWKFLIDYVIYLFIRNNEYERFKKVVVPKEIKFKY